MKKADIIILNYNGAGILPLCLPSIVEAAKRSPIPCQVIVLDNKSADKSLDYIRGNFPQVKIVSAKENRVLFSYNDLIPELDSDIIILLNNDVKVAPDFISPLISRFSSPSVFAVAPKQMNFNGIGYNGGKNKIEFKFGLVKAGQEQYGDNNPVMEKPGYTFYNANSAYDRKKFLELGGFDEIYAPFTWEDTDLGYRSWKTGYKFIYEPKSVIFHNESYTIDREAKKNRGRGLVSKRNSFIFAWKNISDVRVIFPIIILLPVNLIIFLLYDRTLLAGFFEALKYIPKIMARRKQMNYKAKDLDILTNRELL